MKFKPTYLMIKQHTITGKLYFCKTVKSHSDMLKYMGSGNYWRKHISKYGKEYVDTIWYCLYHDQDECNKFAMQFSIQEDIVNSELWANQMEENGIDTRTGACHSEVTKKMMSNKRIEFYELNEHPMKGKAGPSQSDLTKQKRSNSIKKYINENPDKVAASQETRRQLYIQHPELKQKHANPGEKNGMYGVTRPDEWCVAHSNFMKENNPMKGKTGILSPLFGTIPHNKGKTLDERYTLEESIRIRDKIKKAANNRAPVECPQCGKIGSPSNMSRWHFDNCKKK